MTDEFMPSTWRNYGDVASKSGHAGGDFLELVDFIDVIRNGGKPEIGIHEAMDMTLPGLISQNSIVQDGIWIEVPNSRDWVRT